MQVNCIQLTMWLLTVVLELILQFHSNRINTYTNKPHKLIDWHGEIMQNCTKRVTLAQDWTSEPGISKNSNFGEVVWSHKKKHPN